MATYDPETGKVRPTWKVSFSPWAAMLGSLIGGAAAGTVLAIMAFLSSASSSDTDSAAAGTAAITFMGAAIFGFALLGPSLGWGLGFMLRNVENHGLHILAFSIMGLVIGFMIGDLLGVYLGIASFGTAIAPVVGLGAAVGRWSISKRAR